MCLYSGDVLLLMRALVVSGGGRGIFFTGISGSHRGIFFSGIGSGNNVLVWFIFCGRFSGCLAARTASRQVQEAFLFLLCRCCERCLYLWRLY